MTRDRLFLLQHDFADPELGGRSFYCKECMTVEGLLASFPALAERIEVIRVPWPRPRAAVVEAWQPMIRGEFPLRWHPGLAHIGGHPDIALSYGPAWVENADPKASSRFRLGSFVSTWVRDADGAWRVLFDRSAQPFRDASAEEIGALVAALPKECPRT